MSDDRCPSPYYPLDSWEYGDTQFELDDGFDAPGTDDKMSTMWGWAEDVLSAVRGVEQPEYFSQWLEEKITPAVGNKDKAACQNGNFAVHAALVAAVTSEPRSERSRIRFLMKVVDFFSALAMASAYYPAGNDLECLHSSIKNSSDE